MAYTRVDLRDMTLRRMRVLSANEQPSAADAKLVEDALDRLHAQLEGKGLTAKAGGTPWTINTVPDYAADSYAAMCAPMVAADFGLGVERKAELKAEAREGEIELRRQIATPRTEDPTPAIYY